MLLFVSTLFLGLSSSCGNSDYIPKKDMANIIVDLYLADFYIERNPEHIGKTDSLLLYDAVLEKYGYTYEQYQASVRKYVMKDDEYQKIHQLAKNIVDKRLKKTRMLMEIESARTKSIKFWVADSVQLYSVNSLWKRPQLRASKWVARMKCPKVDSTCWSMRADTIVCDFPGNSQWWSDNVSLLFGRGRKSEFRAPDLY